MVEFNWWQIGLDLVWLAILLLMFYHFWKNRQILVHARSWLKTKGRITKCQWSEEGHVLWPKIDYVYQVYEQEIVGHYLFLDTANNSPGSKYSRKIAYNVAVAFKEDDEIDVYYNPNKPEQSALDVTIPTKLNAILFFIGCLTLIHVGTIFLRVFG